MIERIREHLWKLLDFGYDLAQRTFDHKQSIGMRHWAIGPTITMQRSLVGVMGQWI